jgi:hypothetical protein
MRATFSESVPLGAIGNISLYREHEGRIILSITNVSMDEYGITIEGTYMTDEEAIFHKAMRRIAQTHGHMAQKVKST